MNVIRRKWQGLPRGIVVVITALVIYIPLLFIVVQSFLSAPFFARSKEFSLGAFEFIFTDPDFYLALKSGFILAVGLVLIAIPLGGILAFLMVRTDLPGRRFIEPLILVPIFVSPWYWRLAMWSPPGRSVFSRNGQSNCWGLCRGISTRCSALW
jgi:iron(III) transport system permease protein